MNKIARFVIWICSRFSREEIEQIVQGFLDVLANRNPDVKPKDDFKEKHPHYRNFFVDPKPPLKSFPQTAPKLDWGELLSIFVLTAVIHSTFVKSEKRSLFTNVAMIGVHVS